MPEPALEVGEVFRRYGEAYRLAHPGLPSAHRRVMAALASCRTAALGGHLDRCPRCGYQAISYNSCRNRHCPKCQGTARRHWLDARQAELLPVPYFHVVFTLPDSLAALAFQNKRALYGLLFQAASRALLTIARDPKHLGAHAGFLAILHTWGQLLLHHPHLHCLVPGGGLSEDRNRWVPCRKRFLLPVRVLSRLFRRLFTQRLLQLHAAGRLNLTGSLAPLADPLAFAALVRSLRSQEWVVYSKPPFGGPLHVLRYLGRYTHRVAISNHRLVSIADAAVSFRYKDYRHPADSRVLTVPADEFIRRFLIHVLPQRFFKIRYFGLFANRCRASSLARCRSLLGAFDPPPPSPPHPCAPPTPSPGPRAPQAPSPARGCPACGHPILLQTNLPAPTTSAPTTPSPLLFHAVPPPDT